MSKKKITFVHPIIGDRTFEFDHAKNLFISEKTNPSGWKLKNEKDAKLLELGEQKNDNLQNAKDADNGRSNTGGVKDAEAESKDKSSD